MLNFTKCFERVLIKIISDLFPDTSFTDNSKGVTYNCNIFIIQAPGHLQSAKL
jgi:hypothetical protein